MKRINYLRIVLVFLIGFSTQAQTKVWTLSECVKYALENNITIKETELEKRSANIDKREAQGYFLPSFNTNAGHSWNVGLNQNITTGLLENQTTQYTSLGATIGIDIYKGMQNKNALRRANLRIIAAKYQLTKMQEDVALNVANAFLQVLFNKEFLKVQKEQMLINEKQLIRSEELVKVGTIPRGDLLDIKATLASDNQKVIAAENELLLSKLSLAQLLQLKEFYDFDVKEDEDTKKGNTILLTETPITIYQKAKQEQVELKIAKTNLDIAMKDLAISKGAYQPTLKAFYSFNTRASYSDIITGYTPNTANPTSIIGFVEGTNQNVLQPNFSSVTGHALPIVDQFNDNKGQNITAQINIPIFNGFTVKNNVDRSKVNIEKTKIALEQEELTLQRNVFTAYTDAKGALNAYESALAGLESRQGSYDYAKEKYAVGLMNSFDFFQSQSLLTNAQSEVLRTKYDYIFKIKILEYYFGIPII